MIKQAFATILTFVLLAVMLAGCGGYARNYPEPVVKEGHIRARALLSFEEQREYDKIFLEGINQKNKGQLDAAYDLFQRALEINPNASEALFEIGKLQLTLSPKSDSILVDQGEKMLLKALQLEPSNNYYRRTLAERWIRTSKFARAARLYEQMVEQKAKPEDVSMLTRLYEVLGDYPNALKSILQLEKLEGADESTAIEKFRIYMEMGQKAQAFGTIEQLSEDNPQELRYRVLLADLYMQNGYKEKALAIFNDVLTTDPDNRYVKIAMLPYHINDGDTLQFNKDMREVMLDPKIENAQKCSLLQEYASQYLRGAKGLSKESILEHFREALSLPQDDSAIGEMAVLFVETAKLPADSSHIGLEAIVRDQPEHLEARLQLLSYYVKKADTKNIAKLCRAGRELNPDQLIFYYYEGMALLQDDKQEECIATLEQALTHINDNVGDDHSSLDAELTSDIYASLGDIYHQAGRTADSFNAFENALKINPDNIATLNNYAYFLSLERKELDKALEMSKKVINQEKDSPTYLDTYAWVLYCKKQYTQARIYIDQTLKCLAEDEIDAPSSANLYDHAGDIYYKCGKKSMAVQHWQHALSISDDQELISKIKKKLKQYKL